jgi:hypothetical protein
MASASSITNAATLTGRLLLSTTWQPSSGDRHGYTARMPKYRKVDAELMDNPPKPKPRGRPISPEQQALINRMKKITDETVVYEALLEKGEKPATVRAQLMRAAKLAGVDVAVKKSPAGFYFGLMTPKRKSKRGRPRKDAEAA